MTNREEQWVKALKAAEVLGGYATALMLHPERLSGTGGQSAKQDFLYMVITLVQELRFLLKEDCIPLNRQGPHIK